MSLSIRRLLFFLFFVSGFCSLAYQVVWTRMAFASFGIITPVLSVVLSVFMLGLAVGAWAGGRFIASLVEKTGLSAVVFYAGAELLIGLGAFAVPKLFAAGEYFLLAAGQTNSLDYLFLSALVLAIAILPWCVCMGTTFPFMMAYVRERDRQNTASFSYLYLANVLGAMSGTILTAIVLVEMFGFHHTLRIAAAGNFAIAAAGIWLGRQHQEHLSGEIPAGRPPTTLPDPSPSGQPRTRFIKWMLFSTGFCAMAMEVVWTREFTPVLKTQVYSFAWIVFTYLGATFLGSWWYRHHLKKNSRWTAGRLMAVLMVVVFLPILANDPRWVNANWMYNIDVISVMIVLASICPFCAALGYLTPSLIDEHAAGDPAAAGKAYAVNVLGCILGPLFACYVVLPEIGERHALILLGLPFFGFCLLSWNSIPRWQRLGSGLATGVVLAGALFFSKDFQEHLSRSFKGTEVRRDYAASVVATGTGWDRVLLVNGIGMTLLTPITKFMVHLPLAFHKEPPTSALIICFGMGTTYRSALSWDIETTTVELVPDVPRAFGFYHADAAQVLANPKGHLVIDDGRRYLKRTREKFDVIVIDPPPPVEAAGSSLLYSTEFCELAKQHLKPHGILQTWFPGGEPLVAQAVLRSVDNVFPHVRCFGSVEKWGIHILASMDPIETSTPEQLAARMPATAQKDLLEWAPSDNLPAYLGLVLARGIPVDKNLNPDPEIRITDDDPLNEYFLLRQLGL
jgi:spermidine synthase